MRIFLIYWRHKQPRELKVLTSVYKQSLFMNVDILKDAKNKLTSNMIQNMRVFIIIMSML